MSAGIEADETAFLFGSINSKVRRYIMKVKTNIKAGMRKSGSDTSNNHSQTAARSLKVKTNVKAGLIIVVC